MKSITSWVKPRSTTQFGKSCVAVAALAFASFASANPAHAGATVSFGEDKSVSLGLGLRTSFTSVENGAPNGRSNSSDFSLNSIRIYMGASLTKEIKATFNT